MQGRITKVINMKPPEVLSMIEEAAGTKMYENKKEGAIRTIDKKQRKVDEINTLLEEKINPSLAKLERERKHYLEWNQNNNEIETFKRYLIAFRYTEATALLERNSGEGSELHDRLKEIETSFSDLKEQQTASRNNLSALVKAHNERDGSGKLQDTQVEVENLGKKLVMLSSALENQKSALRNEEKILADLEKTLCEHKNKASSLREDMSKVESDVKPAEEGLAKAALDLEMAETALLTGASSQQTHASAVGTGSLIDQLGAARRAATDAKAEMETLKQQRAHITSELENKSAKLAQDRGNMIRILESKKRTAERKLCWTQGLPCMALPSILPQLKP